MPPADSSKEAKAQTQAQVKSRTRRTDDLYDLFLLHDLDLPRRADRFLIRNIYLMLPGASRKKLHDLEDTFPGLDLCCTDPAQRLMTAR